MKGILTFKIRMDLKQQQNMKAHWMAYMVISFMICTSMHKDMAESVHK